MVSQEKIVITGTGTVAGAIARALVPAGYDVSTIGLESKGLSVYQSLAGIQSRPSDVLSLLKGEKSIDPFTPLPVYSLPHIQADLSQKGSWKKVFDGVDTVVLTAANPSPDQSLESAIRNHRIDRNTLENAINSGVKNIIYTSSVWRTIEKSYEETRDVPITPDMESPDKNVPYAIKKAESVRYISSLAKDNKDKLFTHIDLGWYPRETMGHPISNTRPLFIQWWIAESELQQHYLNIVGIKNNPKFARRIALGENHFSFNGFSRNIPPASLNHPGFSYDLTSSVMLGVNHKFNVYDVLTENDSSWRKIPVPSV